MLQSQSQLRVGDNSGIQKVNCIQFKNKGKCAYVGQTIIVSIRKIKPKAKNKLGLKKGGILKVVLVHMRSFSKRKSGFRFKFAEATVIPIKAPGKLYASRVLFPVPRELRNKKYTKICSLSPSVI